MARGCRLYEINSGSSKRVPMKPKEPLKKNEVPNNVQDQAKMGQNMPKQSAIICIKHDIQVPSSFVNLPSIQHPMEAQIHPICT